MKRNSFRVKSSADLVKRCWALVFFVVVLIISVPGMAFDFSLGGLPVIGNGYIKQGINFGLNGDDIATQDGFQQAITEMLLELKCEPNSKVRFFVSGKLNMDQAYPVLSNDSDWKKKGFKKSKDDLQMFDEWDEILSEAHLTWRPNYDWTVRLGKQIIKWGEMDFNAITSIINPSDYRRGITDVEFETLQIPITMAKVNYFPPIENALVTNANLELIWNPNVNFRHDEGFNEVTVGKMGIWAPWLGFPTAGLDERLDFDEPDTWSEGQEFGLRIGADIATTYFQMMAWYGRQNYAVNTVFDFSPDFTTIIQEGFYPRERMLGGVRKPGTAFAHYMAWRRGAFPQGRSRILQGPRDCSGL